MNSEAAGKMTSTPCISARGVGKAYREYPSRWARVADWLLPGKQPRCHERWVLQDVSFEINPGESLGVVGANGAGKSTLLKLITGTTRPTCGEVVVHGRVAALLELGMGFHPDFTGRQNALMAGQLLGYSAEELSQAMEPILDFAEIGDYIDQPVRVYSSGMQMRLAFSVATAIRPDVLIVDEALSVGDAYFQAKCYKRIADFKAQGTTLLLVSHSPGDVVRHCERAILLKSGRVLADGDARDVTNQYLDELFGKRPTDSSAPETPKTPEIFIAQGEQRSLDVFHTRPGYNKNEYRWGHGGAAILDYYFEAGGQAYPSLIDCGAQARFHFRVRFDSDFEGVVPGFLIKTLDGLYVFGTNSILASHGRQEIRVRAGEERVFCFSMPLSLNRGHYLVSFGVSRGTVLEDLVPLDRRYDALLIQVERSVPIAGVVDLGATFHDLAVESVA